jgi:hypothetical protein
VLAFRGGHRHRIEHERRPVVQQPLAFDDGLKAGRETDPPADGDRRDGVRRAEDRPEGEGGGQR